jgi:hypothetical protein
LEDQEKNHGYDNQIGKGFREGNTIAAGVIAAPLIAIGAAEIGAGAMLQQGVSYLMRARSLATGRILLRKMASGLADFSIQMYTKQGDLSKINYTSVLSNIFISNPFLSATTGTLLEVNQKEENSLTPQSGNRFLDAFKGNKSFSVVGETGFSDIIIGTASNMIGGKIAGLMPLSPVQSYLGNATVNLYTEGYKKVVNDKNKK